MPEKEPSDLTASLSTILLASADICGCSSVALRDSSRLSCTSEKINSLCIYQ